jgi:glucose-1-phosphate thymidylyltransferase
MIGILLAGGRGTRLWPLTSSTNKHLLAIYDKPMIYYSLTTLMMTGAKRILLVTNPEDEVHFRKLLGDGSLWGLEITFHIQEEPAGIADSFRYVPEHLRDESVCLMLGDNLLYGMGLGTSLSESFAEKGARIFSYQVSNPSEYGVVEIDDAGRPISLLEKPTDPKTNLAIPGIYFLDKTVHEKFLSISRSPRGEYEIVDILSLYLEHSELNLSHLERGTAWLDTGTPDSLISAGEFVRVIESRQGLKVGCPEEVAFRMKYIDLSQLLKIINKMPNGDYKNYLKTIS